MSAVTSRTNPTEAKQRKMMATKSYTDPRERVHKADIQRMLYCFCERPNFYRDVSEVPDGHGGQRVMSSRVCFKCGKEGR